MADMETVVVCSAKLTTKYTVTSTVHQPRLNSLTDIYWLYCLFQPTCPCCDDDGERT